MFIKIVLFSLACFSLMQVEASAPYAQLTSLSTQVPTTGSVSIVRLDTIDAIFNLELSPSKDTITVKESGFYLIFTGGQVGSTSRAAVGYLDDWIIKNGKPVPNSGSRMTIDPANTTGVLLEQYIMYFKAGDTISIGYASSGPSIGFVFFQPDNEPAIPSMTFTMLKVGE